MALNYSSLWKKETRRIVDELIAELIQRGSLPQEIAAKMEDLVLVPPPPEQDFPYFPIPLKQAETGAALKAIEGLLAAMVLDQREDYLPAGKVEIDADKAAAFMIQTYLTKIGGYGKSDKKGKAYLKDTDINKAQSDPLNRAAANMYRVKDGYYHIHGSLDVAETQRMLGLTDDVLESKRESIDFENPDEDALHKQIVEVYEERTIQWTSRDLEEKNIEKKQAGTKVQSFEEFQKTEHGKIMMDCLPWTVNPMSSTGKAVEPMPFTGKVERLGWPKGDGKRPLAGIKVLELCRIIAGPTIGRILAEYGADVLKITAPKMPDVPWFQLDVNMGKHTAELDLKEKEHLAIFHGLLHEADVVLDGFRSGSLDKFGLSPDALLARAKNRGKGYVYVSENCFGHEFGKWRGRGGWQQIADCVSGPAVEQGKFLAEGQQYAKGTDEKSSTTDAAPVVPPFPMSDYGTLAMGAIMAFVGLWRRAQDGGCYNGDTSLVQYDIVLQDIGGKYDETIRKRIWDTCSEKFKNLTYHNTVEEVSGAALEGMQRHLPRLFNETNTKIYEEWEAPLFPLRDMENKGEIVEPLQYPKLLAVKPVVHIDGADVSHQRSSRPNGTDAAKWGFGDVKTPIPK
ncbi:CoA-transferase family III [Xylariomycetidae sp. FL2044]|nr:CoA-transferase family III [Xylariomycetidae sp. FL2044]